MEQFQEHYKKWFPWLPSKVYIDAFASVLKLWRYILRLAYFILARKFIVKINFPEIFCTSE